MGKKLEEIERKVSTEAFKNKNKVICYKCTNACIYFPYCFSSIKVYGANYFLPAVI